MLTRFSAINMNGQDARSTVHEFSAVEQASCLLLLNGQDPAPQYMSFLLVEQESCLLLTNRPQKR